MKFLKPETFLYLLLGVLSLSCFACPGKDPVQGSAGTLTDRKVVRMFCRDPGSVRVLGGARPEGEIAFIETNKDRKFNGGNRLSFVDSRDFGLEITLTDIPEHAYFTTAFGVSSEAVKTGRDFSAEYQIKLDRAVCATRTLSSFAQPKDRVWYEERVDLSHLAGQSARILMTASVFPANLQLLRGWAEPCLRVMEEVPWNEAQPDQPNLVVILVDTLRPDHLGCYGYGRNTSPHLDALAARSLVFENGVAPCSWTWPSTASLFTGQYPLHHGVTDSVHCTLSLDKETLAELCVAQGMNTGAFVANRLITPSKNFDQGFITFRPLFFEDARVVTDAFAAWLEEVKKGRFMAYLHYMDPHGPYSPPDEYISHFSDPDDPQRMGRDALRDLKRGLEHFKREITEGDRQAVANARDRYDADILFWDEQFGRLVKLLTDQGLMDRTIIVVTSDHGEEFLEHGFFGHGTNLYDTSLRIPLIMHGPGIKPGRMPDQVELVSLAPALVQAAGLNGDAALFDTPSLLEENQGSRRDALAFGQTEHGVSPELDYKTGTYSVRSSHWKYHYNPFTRKARLYHLAEDPGEMNNLAGDAAFAKVKAQLAQALEQWMLSYKVYDAGSEALIDPETREAFEQLGYLGY